MGVREDAIRRVVEEAMVIHSGIEVMAGASDAGLWAARSLAAKLMGILDYNGTVGVQPGKSVLGSSGEVQARPLPTPKLGVVDMAHGEELRLPQLPKVLEIREAGRGVVEGRGGANYSLSVSMEPPIYVSPSPPRVA